MLTKPKFWSHVDLMTRTVRQRASVRASRSRWTGFLFPPLQVKALGCDGSTSLASWLDGLGLHEYLPNFLSSGYRTLECVKNLWELEIINVRRRLSLFCSAEYFAAPRWWVRSRHLGWLALMEKKMPSLRHFHRAFDCRNHKEVLDDGGICIKLKQKHLSVINRYLADKIIDIHSGKTMTGRWIIGVIFVEMIPICHYLELQRKNGFLLVYSLISRIIKRNRNIFSATKLTFLWSLIIF